jgi:hypothetical protein
VLTFADRLRARCKPTMARLRQRSSKTWPGLGQTGVPFQCY